MDSLLSDFHKLEKNGDLTDGISNVEKLEEMLVAARDRISSGIVTMYQRGIYADKL